jgi:hypothetical protein
MDFTTTFYLRIYGFYEFNGFNGFNEYVVVILRYTSLYFVILRYTSLNS